MLSATGARLAVACFVGACAQEGLPRPSLLYSDFWESYQKALPEGRHRPVGKSSGHTSHLERWKCTLRQRPGRFVRKTLSFSKSEEMHEICLVLFLHDYNRLCINNTR
jgi:insertion element IS1 protein InsB